MKFLITFQNLYKDNKVKKYSHPLILINELEVPYIFNHIFNDNITIESVTPCLIFSYYYDDNNMKLMENIIHKSKLEDDEALDNFVNSFSTDIKFESNRNVANNEQNIQKVQKEFIKLIRFLRLFQFENVNMTVCLFWYELHIGKLQYFLNSNEYSSLFNLTRYFKDLTNYRYDIVAEIYKQIKTDDKTIQSISNIIKNYFNQHDPLCPEIKGLIDEVNKFTKVKNSISKKAKGAEIDIIKKFKDEMLEWSETNVNQKSGNLLNEEIKPPFDKFRSEIIGKINYRYLLFLSSQLTALRENENAQKRNYESKLVLKCDSMHTIEAYFSNVTIEIPEKIDIDYCTKLILFSNNELIYKQFKLPGFEDLSDNIKEEFVFDASEFIKMLNNNERNLFVKLLMKANISCEQMILTTYNKIVTDCILSAVSAKDIRLTNLTMDGVSFIREKIMCDYFKNDFILMNNWLRENYRLTHTSINESIQDYFIDSLELLQNQAQLEQKLE